MPNRQSFYDASSVAPNFAAVETTFWAHGFEHETRLDSNSIDEFTDFLQTGTMGYLMLLTHGDTTVSVDCCDTFGHMMVEFYWDQASAAARLLAIRAMARYVSIQDHILLTEVEVSSQPLVLGYGISVDTSFIRYFYSRQGTAVLLSHCSSACPGGTAQAFRERGAAMTAGWLNHPPQSEAIWALHFQSYHMSGCFLTGGARWNKTGYQARTDYVDWSSYDSAFCWVLGGNDQLTFYNSPRIVGVTTLDQPGYCYGYTWDQFLQQWERPVYPYVAGDYPGDTTAAGEIGGNWGHNTNIDGRESERRMNTWPGLPG